MSVTPIRIRTTRTVVAAGLVGAAVAFSGVGAVVASGSTPREIGQTGTASAASAAAPSKVAAAAAAPRFCSGGAFKRMQAVGSNSPTTIDGAAQVTLTPTPLTVVGPAKGTDTLLLTWTSETQLRGNTKGADFDWIKGLISVNGVAVTDNGVDQLALSGASSYASNGTQVCLRVGKGVHRIRLAAKVVNTSGQAESAWLDDWLLRVDVLD
jgi:hypothetical protein